MCKQGRIDARRLSLFLWFRSSTDSDRDLIVEIFPYTVKCMCERERKWEVRLWRVGVLTFPEV